MSPKQLLGDTELQHHVCDPLEYTQRPSGNKETIKNTVLPRHDSRLTGHLTGSNMKPSAHDLSRHQYIEKPLKFSHSHAISQHQSSDQRNQDGIMKHHQSGLRRGDWRQSRESHSPQEYHALARENVHQQNIQDRVTISLLALLWLVNLTLSM